MYRVSDYTRAAAKRIGVIVKSSTRKAKKLDVFDLKTGKYITSIGSIAHNDYPKYLRTRGKKYADERRRLYRIRHRANTGEAGRLASALLW